MGIPPRRGQLSGGGLAAVVLSPAPGPKEFVFAGPPDGPEAEDSGVDAARSDADS